MEREAGRHLISTATVEGEAILEGIRRHPKVVRASLAGRVRRGVETVDVVDVVGSAAAADHGEVMEAFLDLCRPLEVTARGNATRRVRLRGGLQVELTLVEDRDFAAALLHLTGSGAHAAALSALARRRGLSLDRRGLSGGGDPIPVDGEEDLYRALGLPMIPPELREDDGEIEAAVGGGLPDLIEEGDLQGLIHVHTTWSDARASLEEMVRAARDRGYRYIGISDHSGAAFYARGLDPDRLRLQGREIDQIAARFPEIRILKGAEVDILPDGRLDYPDEVLEELDFVVASVHSSLEMEEEAQTERVLRALRNPHVTILGHPSGRLLLERGPIRIDLPPVVQEAARRGVAVEISASPHRLDLDWRHLRAAKQAGARFSINPDAHSTRAIDHVAYGVKIARKGWLERQDVINTWPVEEFLSAAKRS